MVLVAVQGFQTLRPMCTDMIHVEKTTGTTVLGQQIENGKGANQVHGVTIDYGI